MYDNIKAAVSNGRIFSVTFVKKDGTVRKMVCRVGVRKGVNGKGLAYDAASRGILTVWDMQARGFRSVDVSRILSMRVQGCEYTWQAEEVACAA